MMHSHLPTVLASRSVQGIVPSSSHGNVAWNEDGQCLLISKRSLSILTPCLSSSLVPPPQLVDPNMNLEYPVATLNKAKRASKMGIEEPMEIDTPAPEAQAGTSKVNKPKEETRWWVTGMDVDKEGNREKRYGWADIGDEFGAVASEKEIFVKKAIWSPSGLTELGSCLFVLMTSTGQVSVYTPRSDPSSKQWDEIADMTVLTRDMLTREIPGWDGELTVPIMLQMRATSMSWSTKPFSPKMLGNDGSILAIANRAGMVALWSYGQERRFTSRAYLKVTDTWVSHMAWSDWQGIGEDHHVAHLAIAMTDGVLGIVPIRRGITEEGGSKGWDIAVKAMTVVDQGDRRLITALTWIDGVLVWTKSGSVHMWSEENERVKWSGLKMMKLERVGSWAGANSLGACAGIQKVGTDSILVTLSALTQHLVIDLHTSPKLAPLPESLRLSIATRDCIMDGLKSDRKYNENEERALTALTAGIGGVCGSPDVLSWTAEVMNMHNLDNSTEGQRMVHFTVADLGSLTPRAGTVVDELEKILDDPPSPLTSSTIKLLTPIFLRMLSLSRPATIVRDLLDLCSAEISSSNATSTSGLDVDRQFMQSLWGTSTLNGLRIRLVLSQWASRQFPSSASDFQAANQSLDMAIRSILLGALASWAAKKIENNGSAISSKSNRQFCALLAPACSSYLAPTTNIDRLEEMIGLTQLEEKCLACKEPLNFGERGVTRCSKGHEWSRCCITQMVITNPVYRVCATCPAVSLLPDLHKSHPIPVSRSGTSKDWQRFVRPTSTSNGQSNGVEMEGTEPYAPAVQGVDLVQLALEAAICCPMCGGRWTRVA